MLLQLSAWPEQRDLRLTRKKVQAPTLSSGSAVWKLYAVRERARTGAVRGGWTLKGRGDLNSDVERKNFRAKHSTGTGVEAGPPWTCSKGTGKMDSGKEQGLTEDH